MKTSNCLFTHDNLSDCSFHFFGGGSCASSHDNTLSDFPGEMQAGVFMIRVWAQLKVSVEFLLFPLLTCQTRGETMSRRMLTDRMSRSTLV